jgi:uncharacterized SAM-binding protein YcdF (DUF218 family)
MGRRLTRRLTVVLAIGVVTVVVLGVLPVAPVLFRLFLVSDPPRRADAIVVLAGGILDDESPTNATTVRLVHGLRLFHRGYAPLVILSGGNPAAPQHPESVVMRRVATELGTRPEVLVVETVADRTSTQGEAVARIARERGIRTILLVTSPEHSWRASRVFRRAGFDVVSTPVVGRRMPRLTITVHPRAIVERTIALVPIVYETTALTLYWWRGWL